MSIHLSLARAALLLTLAAALAACQGGVAPAPPTSAATGFGSLTRSADWGFGMRTQTPGYTFDRGGTGGA